MSFPRIINPKVAIVILSMYAFVCGCFATYLVSMVTTLERRFELSTSTMGWILSSDSIGFICTVLLVTYFGSKNREALVLSLSAVGLFIAALFRAAPFFVFGPKVKHSPTASDAVAFNSTSVIDVDYQRRWGIALFICGGLVDGVASTPFWNIGLSIIDDMGGNDSGLLMGFLFLIRTLSPIVGFVLGGQLTNVNEGLVLKATDFMQGVKDPLWIGAWWLGILCVGGIILLNTPLLALLDVKKLRAAGERDRAKIKDDSGSAGPTILPAVEFVGSVTSLNQTGVGEGQLDIKNLSISELFQFLKTLYTNPVFITMYFGSVFEFGAFMIFLGYFPKFIEYHFYVSANTASLMSSGSLAGASALAIIISGLLTKIFPMSLTHMNLYHAVVNILSALAFPVLILFDCGSVDMIGPHNHAERLSSPVLSCMDASSCPKYSYDPVCINGTSYMSSCFAGCTKSINVMNSTDYMNCLCSNATAESGVCKPQCSSVYIYLILFFVIRVVGTMAAVHFTIIIMRLPNSRELKPLAMGSISFLFGLLGVVTPPLGGKLIDTVCIVQNPSESGRSFCLFYDTDKFRYLMHGIAIFCQIPSCLLFFLSYWFSRTRYPVSRDEVTLARRRRRQQKADKEDELRRMPASSSM